jgi:uncharacterized membrane protein YeaQ/YmgE (transglycosylase-associated protein family)
MHVLVWALAGFIIGTCGRWLMPGRQTTGVPLTILMGVFGALVGGGISFLIWGGPNHRFAEHPWGGYLVAIGFSLLCVWAVSYSGRRRPG